MPFKRKRSYSSSRVVRRRVSRQRSSRKRIMRARLTRTLNIHNFCRWGNDVTVSVNNVASYSVAETFQLSALPNVTEFGTLYDMFRINKVIMYIRLITNPDADLALNNRGVSLTTQYGNVCNFFPSIWYCRDYDDANTETLAELRERCKTKQAVLRPDKDIRIAITPAVAAQLYQSATGTAYSAKWKQWVDMSQNTTPHYGLKWCIDNMSIITGSTDYFKVQVRYKYYFTCKDVR